ncbi:autotransporter assembly complex protein TamA [Roseospira navarrensis]|uniref:BamA/TamA family outer membrane protein n=1 Tax=Roseospira navarrensis TaxID=140058 RepID=A0A7X2D3Y8_9PROT|nr:autotransporter assembly complex family protein [Roseospira navarrensis]MQX36097.1 BamA/TamA family outer membrane protein [Roseospira navarrensis]
MRTRHLFSAGPARRSCGRAGLAALVAGGLVLGPPGALRAQGDAQADTQGDEAPAAPSAAENDGDGEGDPAPAPIAGPRVDYTVDLTVTDPVEGVDLAGTMEAAFNLLTLQDEPPASRLGLRRRLDSDLETAQAVLRSEGFYAGTVTGEIGEGSPAPVTITVTPGPRYSLAETAVAYRDNPTDTATLPRTLTPLGLTQGDPARADAVLEAERALVERLQREGRPFAEAMDRRVAVNHARRTMVVRIEVQAGPPSTFGPVVYEGLDRVKRDFLDDQVPWRVGEAFDNRELDRFRNSILTTRLFDSVTVRPASAPEPDGSLPVIVSVTEAPPRSIGGGLRYATDDGPGARVFWEHRNLFGRAERLRINIDGALTAQRVEAAFTKPRFLHPDQSLSVTAEAERADRDAYTGLTGEVGAAIERRINDTWRASAGALLDYAQLDDQLGDRRTSYLVGLPVGVTRDDTDDPLNPTSGSRLSATFTPYFGATELTPITFGVVDVSGSAYLAPLDSDRLVLAARGRLASLFGTETVNVPANKRLFAGGGGSVRGFGHQMVGPLDPGGDPIGGRSALEAGFEARIKITDSIGVVPFLDAGLVTDSTMPDFSEDILYAAGLGARYYTDFGPLRLDIAVPLNPRDADNFVQVYISVGQAF